MGCIGRWILLCASLLTLSASRLSAQERWVYRYNGPADSTDEASRITMGTDGNLYAAGRSQGIGTGSDFTIISLDTLGAERWVYRHEEGSTAHSTVMGRDANIYAAGARGGSQPNFDFVVVSTTPSGAHRWVYTYNGPGNGWDEAYSIVMGTDRNLYVAGWSEGTTTFLDFLVLSLTSAGEEHWVYAYHGPGNYWDLGYSIAAGADGNVYAAGHSSGGAEGFTVISLDTAGTERWVYGGGAGEAWSIVAGRDSNLYAAEYTWGGPTRDDFTAIALGPDVGIQESSNDQLPMTKSQALHNYPNPFTNTTTINYTLPSAVGREQTAVALSIYDLCGRLVKTLIDGSQPTAYSLPVPSGAEGLPPVAIWDCRDSKGNRVPSGAYFVRLQTPDFSASRKLIILR